MVAPRRTGRAKADTHANPKSPAGGVRPRIVQEATRLFSEHGFDGTAVQDIASAVGVTKPAVLHHFPSKEHVQDAVMSEILQHWEATLPKLLGATAGEGRFETVLGEVYRFFADDPARTRVVLRYALDRPAEARVVLRERVRPWLGTVAAYVERGRARGVHHADIDPDAYVLSILQLVIMAAASFQTTREALPGGSKGRYEHEIFRIARASLFSQGPPEEPARPRANKKKRA
jgi:AcrR family transcriptional regulator